MGPLRKGTAVSLAGPSHGIALSQGRPQRARSPAFQSKNRCEDAQRTERGRLVLQRPPGSPPGHPPENSDSCIACVAYRGAGPCEMGVSTLDFSPPCLLREQPFLRPRRSRKQMTAVSSGSFVLISLWSLDPRMAVGFQDSALSSFSAAGWCWGPTPTPLRSGDGIEEIQWQPGGAQ